MTKNELLYNIQKSPPNDQGPQRNQKSLLSDKKLQRFIQSQKPPIVRIVKRHVFPKKSSQHHEIKILNSKRYDEQLNLAISSIKNKLFETTKEFKEFKFHQNLAIEFTRNDEVFKIEYSQTHGLI